MLKAFSFDDAKLQVFVNYRQELVQNAANLIWDMASVAAFYNMTNRHASATDMRPNSVYHCQVR